MLRQAKYNATHWLPVSPGLPERAVLTIHSESMAAGDSGGRLGWKSEPWNINENNYYAASAERIQRSYPIYTEPATRRLAARPCGDAFGFGLSSPVNFDRWSITVKIGVGILRDDCGPLNGIVRMAANSG